MILTVVRWALPLVLLGCLLCTSQAPTPAVRTRTEAAISIESLPFAESGETGTCRGAFVPHRLDIATGIRLREIGTYLSNGAGVAAGDLDNDGDLDLVFASIDRESSILWNRGRLEFAVEPLDARFTRGAAVVDVDGDGWRDVVFTHRGLGGVSYWRNQGIQPSGEAFIATELAGVEQYAYAMAWGDLNGDGRLDLVTGSYGAELKQHGITNPEQEGRAGVVVHWATGDGYVSQTLDREAEALSIAVVDMDGDERPEVWVANDFAPWDRIWRLHEGRWIAWEPFATTSHSTMSIEWGDIGNDGRRVFLTTDMNPYDISPHNMAAWLPMMRQMGEHREAGDPQLMANVLQVPNAPRGNPGWRNQAAFAGVEATGWSWAARFGDLDQDGLLDLYIVNGMIAVDMFGHLPGGELVEENQAFRNQGNGRFAAAPEWGLGATASGRGMVMADLDLDGDLDIVVNNLRSFAQVFENQLCQGDSLQIDLEWADSANRDAVGAELVLYTRNGVFHRDVRASGGYLSGDPSRVHFGFPVGTRLERLEIIWPDGAVSAIDDPRPNLHLIVTRPATLPPGACPCSQP